MFDGSLSNSRAKFFEIKTLTDGDGTASNFPPPYVSGVEGVQNENIPSSQFFAVYPHQRCEVMVLILPVTQL